MFPASFNLDYPFFPLGGLRKLQATSSLDYRRLDGILRSDLQYLTKYVEMIDNDDDSDIKEQRWTWKKMWLGVVSIIQQDYLYRHAETVVL